MAERKGARATTAAPEAASQLQEARKIVATAAKVGARAKGHRTRKCFRDFVVKFGVVGDRIVPKTPAKFQGRVNVASPTGLWVNVSFTKCGNLVVQRSGAGYDVRIVNNMGKEVPRGKQGNIGVKVKPDMPPGLFKVRESKNHL